jgi:hypothetical protein
MNKRATSQTLSKLADALLPVFATLAALAVGKVINPFGLQGEVEGGVIMGIGHKIKEGLD